MRPFSFNPLTFKYKKLELRENVKDSNFMMFDLIGNDIFVSYRAPNRSSV